MRYKFGENWSSYAKEHLNDEAVTTATDHLTKFLGIGSLSGLSFLDIGCGSGVHALGALNLGCERLVAFDYDPDSVQTTRSVLERSERRNWALHQGSILDRAFVSSLGTFDVVYSWGVLHHTGNVWEALENAVSCVSPGGYLYIALYEREMHRGRKASFWLKIKKAYNRGGWIRRRIMEGLYVLSHCSCLILQGTNPLKFIRNYGRGSRGMDYLTDVRDWLGGWPMEFVSINDVFRKLSLDGCCTLRNLRFGEANTEYLFQRNS
jgi:SAM-dependent methyltransferase